MLGVPQLPLGVLQLGQIFPLDVPSGPVDLDPVLTLATESETYTVASAQPETTLTVADGAYTVVAGW